LKRIYDDKILVNATHSDLLYDLNITLHEALYGFEKSIRHFDRVLSVSYNKLLWCGEYLIYKKHGMPVSGSDNLYGDMYIRINIEKPSMNIEKLCKKLSVNKVKYKTTKNLYYYEGDTK
jgi:DnaJ-class molecular chaperone